MFAVGPLQRLAGEAFERLAFLPSVTHRVPAVGESHFTLAIPIFFATLPHRIGFSRPVHAARLFAEPRARRRGSPGT